MPCLVISACQKSCLLNMFNPSTGNFSGFINFTTSYNKKCSLSHCLSLYISLCFLQHRALLRSVKINKTCISLYRNCSLFYCLSLYSSLCFSQHRALLRPVKINTTCICLHRNCTLSHCLSLYSLLCFLKHI